MYGMFTTAGDVAVEAIVNHHLGQDYENPTAMFYAIHDDLSRLETVSCFSEATDTEVRERVWIKISSHYRKKEVDMA